MAKPASDKITLRDLMHGVDFDAHKVRPQQRLKVDDNNIPFASLDQLEALTQNEDWEDNLYAHGKGPQRVQAQQGNPYQELPPPQQLPETVKGYEDANFRQAIAKAWQHKAETTPQHEEEPESDIDYDPTSLVNQLMIIRDEAAIQGKSVQLTNSPVNKTEYLQCLSKVIKTMSSMTGMQSEYRGGNKIIAFWQNEQNEFTGFNRIYLNDPKEIAFAIMTVDNPEIEDELISVSYGANLAEFTTNLEGFFCTLFKRHLGLLTPLPN